MSVVLAMCLTVGALLKSLKKGDVMRGHPRAVLSYQTRREVLERLAPRYHAASRAHKIL